MKSLPGIFSIIFFCSVFGGSIAAVMALDGKGGLPPCTGQTESSAAPEVIDCEEDTFLCPPLDNNTCTGSQIVYSGEQLTKRPCVAGAAVSNWKLDEKVCATMSQCNKKQSEMGGFYCDPSGGTSEARVGECRMLVGNCAL